MSHCPEVGQLVSVRKRPFVVTEVIPSVIDPIDVQHSKTHLLKLSSVEDDGLGEELEVIWELEAGTDIQEKSTLPEPVSFDAPKRLQAFLDAVRWGSVSQSDDKALQSPFRSGIEIDDYQLDPVVRALSMPRVNLLIADDVGLGKTIEAGLVVQEMILRHRVRSVLIICPSSLQIQWQEEMRDKFGLDFRIIDSESVSQLRRKRGIHVNPWSHFPRLITSIDYLKRERPLRAYKETLPTGDEPTYPRAYDLLIVDEAHNVAPSGRGKYATDSMRTLAIRTLAPHFEHKLFLSATPHNGYTESFAALMELLDNQRFARAVTPSRAQLDAVMIRRMKSELMSRWDGSARFSPRIVRHIEVPYSAAERQAHKWLQEYSESRLKGAKTDGERVANEFVLKLLKKRLFSSPAAFVSTLEKHMATVSGQKAGHSTALQRELDEYNNYDNDYDNDELYEQQTTEVVVSASQVLSPLTADEKTILQQLKAFATQAASKPDCKTEALMTWLKANLRPNGQWNNERVIIFTEYRATQKWLYDLMAHQGFAEDGRVELIYGGMPSEHREPIKAAFQAHPNDAKVRILLATDAASEGLNLQNHCSKLIHIEIPWNPNRMEQRNGRVDRHGQKAAEVHIHHFVGQGFSAANMKGKVGDLEADLEFLMRAALKIETIREDLGKVGPVIASQVEEAMLGKRVRLDTTRAEQDAEPARKMLKFERNLRDQLKKLAAQLDETKKELNLTPEHIQNVVRVGLELAGQSALISATLADSQLHGTQIPVFRVPALSGSWQQCMDGLAHSHTHIMRPITFDASIATGRDDVVLAHLNHRLVQMCLRLLRAEIWSNSKKAHGLSRVTAVIVDDADLRQPTIIAHGRIVVLGGDNQRIHEEVIMAGGALVEGRFNRLNVGDTKNAYAALTDTPVPSEVHPRFQALWPKHQAPLMAALEARCVERTKNLDSNLKELADKEVNKLQMIMTELQRSIQDKLQPKNNPQLLLDLGGDEKSQCERDLSSLRRRLAEIPAEIERESAYIRQRYQQSSVRLFPVAVTYLVPRKAVRELLAGVRA